MMQRLLPISPGNHLEEAGLVQAAAGLVKAGVCQVLLREPLLQPEVLHVLLDSLGDLSVILHERCAGAESLASVYGCGLHISSSTPVGHIRARFVGLLGVSTHNSDELVKAEAEGADYALLSPLHPPYSKPGDTRPPLGLERARAAIDRVSIPVFLLGGIDEHRARDCRETGAYGVAAVGALFGVGVDTHRAAGVLLSALG